jgi:hypothetical protein
MADVSPLCRDYNVLPGAIHISIEPEHVSELFDVHLAIDIYLPEAYYIEHRLFPLGISPLILGIYSYTPDSILEELLWINLFIQTDPP